MCGIALILSEIRVDLTRVSGNELSSPAKTEEFVFTLDDLKAALSRRGPDSLASKTVHLQLREQLLSFHVEDKKSNGETHESQVHSKVHQCTLRTNGQDGFSVCGKMHFVGAVLQLRGRQSVMQPLSDACENILVYNGEVFGGLEMKSDDNDAEELLKYLGNCCYKGSEGHVNSCRRKHIPELLSSIKGPWALIYWQESCKKLWFGRDAFGRRSLLVHWPTSTDPRLLLSSVSPPASSNDSEVDNGSTSPSYWEELPCGIYSIEIDGSTTEGGLIGKVEKHSWTNSMLNDLIGWKRNFIQPVHDELNSHSNRDPVVHAGDLSAASNSTPNVPSCMVLSALRQSIARRTVENAIFQAVLDDHTREELVPVAVLFSGGVDSMILAAILHECLNARYVIDLINVSFEGESAPDRITARAGLEELKRIAPSRRWRLVEIDSNLSNLSVEMNHVMSLINPAQTYMDLNIGTALWLAAGGDGWVYENGDKNAQRVKYKSEARILLVGSGADEQCAGYGRHRTKYRNASWAGLNEEMKLDMQRIWKRNLGRDDRCIADNGKEARFPFLDEDVIRVLLDFPLWDIADLDQPSGTGDKKILRDVARLLGLNEAAALPKRAIQFGTRIARESNKKNFGSNRAANQASAGSVVIHKCSHEGRSRD